jgi:O-antigen/teichoic acid export membrane protein
MQKPASRPRPTPFSAGGWSMTSFVISQAIGTLIYLPLARLLTPEEFGLQTMAVLVSAALTLVGELSLFRPLVRLEGDRDRLARATLWLALPVGLGAATLCALAGAPLAAIYDEPRLRTILPALAPGVLFTALGAVPQALLARELDFRRKTLPDTISITGGGLIALAAALLGAGVFSLVLWIVVRQGLAALVAWLVVSWRPRTWRRPDGATTRRILGFGLPTAGGDLALYARLNADYAITGRALGADALGVYTLAWSASAGPASLLAAPFAGVGLPTFSRLQHDRERLRDIYLSVTRLIAALALPFFVSAVVVRADVVAVLYGERWAAMAAPLLPLFLLQAVRETARPGAALTLACGHGRLYALNGLLALPLTVVAVLAGTRWGIDGVAWAVLGAVGVSSAMWIVIATALLRPGLGRWARVFAPAAALTAATAPAAALAELALAGTGLPQPLRLAVAIGAAALVYRYGVHLLWPMLRQDIARLRQALPEEEPAHAPAASAGTAPLPAAPERVS